MPSPLIPASANRKYVTTITREETKRLFPGVPMQQVLRDEKAVAMIEEAVRARYWKKQPVELQTVTYHGAISEAGRNESPTDERSVMLKKLSIETIEKQYRDNKITAGERTGLLREKANVELDFLVSEQGYLKAIVQKSMDNFKQGWDNLIEAATHDTTPTMSGDRESGSMAKAVTKDVKRELYYAGLAMWGQGQMLLSVMNAVGEVTGKVAEKQALSYGASPGAAMVLGVLADIGTGFIPVAGAARLFAKSVQALPKAGEKIAAKAEKVMDLAPQSALRVIGQGLSLDGVNGAGRTMSQAAKSFETGAAKAGNAGLEEAVNRLSKGLQDKIKAISNQPVVMSFTDEVARLTKGITPEDASRELPSLMKKFGISYPDLKTIKAMWEGSASQAMTATQFWAHLKALEPRAHELGLLAQRAAAQGAGTREQLDFVRAATQLFTGSSERIVYSKEFTNMLLHWDPKNMAKGDIGAAMTTFAADMAKLAVENPTNFNKLALNGQEGFIKFGAVGRGLRELYTNLLLPLSASPAWISNSMATTNMILERFASGGAREAAYMMKGMALATMDSMNALKMAAQIGTPGIVPGAIGYIERLPTTSTVAVDQAFKVLNARGVMYADAIREAHKQTAIPIGQFVHDAVANPSNAMIQHAWDLANRATFTNDLGHFASRWKEMAQAGPGTLYFAFMKSQINLAKYAWDRTPGLQFVSKKLYEDILAGGDRAQDAIGRLTISNLFGMTIFELAKEGLLTGSGPVDPALRGGWLAVNQPNSIKGKEGFIPIKNLSPAAQTIGMITDLVEIHDQLDDMTAGQLGMAIVYSMVNNIANETWWRTMTDVIDVIHGVSKGEGLTGKDVRTVMSPVTAIVTGGPIGTRIEAHVDPVLRDARNYLDAVRARIPGYSDSVPALRDKYGDPIIPPQNIGSAWFGYFNPVMPRIRAYEDDRVKKEGARLQARLPNFEDSIGGTAPRDPDTDLKESLPGDLVGVKLSPKQRDRWQQIYRNIIRHPEHGIEARLLDAEEYRKHDDGSSTGVAYKRQLFQSFMQEAKAIASDALMVEDVELGKKVLTNEAARLMPLLSQQEQVDETQNLREGIDLFEQMSEEEKENFSKFGALDADQPKQNKPASVMGVQVAPAEYVPKPNMDLTIFAPGAKVGP